MGINRAFRQRWHPLWTASGPRARGSSPGRRRSSPGKPLRARENALASHQVGPTSRTVGVPFRGTFRGSEYRGQDARCSEHPPSTVRRPGCPARSRRRAHCCASRDRTNFLSLRVRRGRATTPLAGVPHTERDGYCPPGRLTRRAGAPPELVGRSRDQLPTVANQVRKSGGNQGATDICSATISLRVSGSIGLPSVQCLSFTATVSNAIPIGACASGRAASQTRDGVEQGE